MMGAYKRDTQGEREREREGEREREIERERERERVCVVRIQQYDDCIYEPMHFNWCFSIYIRSLSIVHHKGRGRALGRNSIDPVTCNGTMYSLKDSTTA